MSISYRLSGQQKTIIEANYSIMAGPANALSTVEAVHQNGKVIYVCGRVVKHSMNDTLGFCDISDKALSKTITLIIKLNKFKPDTTSLVGHMFCISGKVVKYKHKPTIFVTDAAQLGGRVMY